MIGTILRTFLLADPTVSALVGGERIHPVVLPQGASEASVSYRRISGRGVHGTAGRLNLNGPRIQIDAYSRSADEASELADAIRDRIDGHRGAAGSVRFKGIFLANEQDLFDPDVKIRQRSASSSCFMHVAFIFVPFRCRRFDCDTTKAGAVNIIKAIPTGASIA